VSYTNASAENVVIGPVKVTEMPADEEEQIDWALMILGTVYRSYSIVDAWFVRTPGDLVVDEDGVAVEGYLPVLLIGSNEIMPYKSVDLALKAVFGGREYAPELYDLTVFKDVGGKLYVRKDAPKNEYEYLPDINYAAVTEITEKKIVFQAPVINRLNATSGTLTITITGEDGVWRFASDIHREYVLNV